MGLITEAVFFDMTYTAASWTSVQAMCSEVVTTARGPQPALHQPEINVKYQLQPARLHTVVSKLTVSKSTTNRTSGL